MPIEQIAIVEYRKQREYRKRANIIFAAGRTTFTFITASPHRQSKGPYRSKKCIYEKLKGSIGSWKSIHLERSSIGSGGKVRRGNVKKNFHGAISTAVKRTKITAFEIPQPLTTYLSNAI